MTAAEITLARERIRLWPKTEREFLTRLEPKEVEAVMLLVALLDLSPVDEIPEGCIEL